MNNVLLRFTRNSSPGRITTAPGGPQGCQIQQVQYFHYDSQCFDFWPNHDFTETNDTSSRNFNIIINFIIISRIPVLG